MGRGSPFPGIPWVPTHTVTVRHMWPQQDVLSQLIALTKAWRVLTGDMWGLLHCLEADMEKRNLELRIPGLWVLLPVKCP